MRIASQVSCRSWVLVLLCAGIIAIPARSGDTRQSLSDAPSGTLRLTGFAAASRKATLSSTVDGRIGEQLCSEGDFVKCDQLLARLDDRVQRARAEVARVAAESKIEVAIASVRAEFAQAEVEHVRQLGRTDLASARELRVAESNAATTALEITQAETQQRESEQNYRLQRMILDEHEMRAPFDGFVSAIAKQVGEVVEAREGVLTLVQLDPLEVALDCPVDAWRDLKVGDKVRVAPDDGLAKPREGVISFVNRVADAASQTFKIKVRVPNPRSDWIAGLRVAVDFAPTKLPPTATPAVSHASGKSEETP